MYNGIQDDVSRGSILKIILICTFVMSGSFLFGIDAGELGGFLAMAPFQRDFGKYNPKTKAWAIPASEQLALQLLVNGGALIASLVAGPIGARYGRRVGLTVTGGVALLACIIQITATNVTALYFGRLFSGAGIGFSSNFVNIYNAEVSAPHIRGMMIALYQTGINIGQVIGACVNQGTYLMPNRWSYRIPLITQMFFPAIICTGIWLMPETPRWLLSKDRTEDASRAIRRLRGRSYPEGQIHAEVDEIAKYIRLERELAKESSYMDCFRGSDLRRTHIACGVVGFQVITGIQFISIYGAYFFSISGLHNSFIVNIALQACALAGIVTVFPSLKFMGRRTILLIGSFLMSLSMFLVAIIGTADAKSVAASRCLVAFCCLFGYFFTWSWGPVGWVVTSEIASTTLRSKTQSLASATSWVGQCVISVIIPYMINPSYGNMGPKVGFVFGPTCVIGGIWAWFMVPETKDRSLEELDEMFMNGVPTREFKNYVCTGHVAHEKDKMTAEEDKADVHVVEYAA